MRIWKCTNKNAKKIFFNELAGEKIPHCVGEIALYNREIERVKNELFWLGKYISVIFNALVFLTENRQIKKKIYPKYMIYHLQ